ncbi:ABC transporter ATP-binding protein [Brachybacterium sp. YJGR34]|uniref:ABC transporter ATP-binding protein n=1 Tax=Brachybacterium sp. YJGR34 TaxID=2059911 RepID=UPI000E0C26D8|nr:ABC transporter ATP-binding protein [Brachybacterium sp. YJGR34]
MTTIATRPPLLRARGLERRLGGSTVLHGIDLDLADGELLAVMGPSGSGKSTLLHSLAGLDRPDAGTVSLDGADLTTATEKELARRRLIGIGIVFQQINLLRHLTLLDNVVLPGLLARREPRSAILTRARELMTRLGVAELADRGVAEASGGQLQRAAICRALINRPPVLLADEPTGALDSEATGAVLDALAAVNRSGTSILLVTHDIEVAAQAHRVIRMEDGRIDREIVLGERGHSDAPEELRRRSAQVGER